MLRSVLWVLAAHAAAACTRDEDCSLNGVCAGGGCRCDAAWTGPSCGVLAVQPWSGTPAYGGAKNGTEGFSAWGGVPVRGDDGRYHLYVANVPGTIMNWAKESRIDHAVAEAVEGPYAFQDVVLPKFAHNPHMVRQRLADGSVLYVLFHIGHGGIHVAQSPDGPFVDATPKGWSCNNPAPVWDEGDGAWYVVCNHAEVLTAAALAGPWTKVGVIPVPYNGERRAPLGDAGAVELLPCNASRGVIYEDPYLWRDFRGNWHVLFHAYEYASTADCRKAVVSAHSFSRDLKTWSALPELVQPYTAEVRRVDNTTEVMASLERPKFVFDAAGRITHIFNGAVTLASCLPNCCVHCKYFDTAMNMVRAVGQA